MTIAAARRYRSGSVIDHQLKTYSSGMVARLGLSMALSCPVDVLLIGFAAGVTRWQALAPACRELVSLESSLVMAAAKTWRRLKGENQLPKVVQGVTFSDGVEVTDTPAQHAA